MAQAQAKISGRILLVDDDPGLLRLLSIRLRAEGYDVEAVESAQKALSVVGRFAPDLVITDLRMDKMDGIGLLKELQTRSPGLRVVIITAHGTIPDAVAATQSGAFGFLTKPIDKDELMATVEKALRVSGSVEIDEDWAGGIITRNQSMKEILNQAKMVAATDARVLINGESGTGKELLAQAIHNASPRANKPFVAINCSAIPKDLIEAELFGVEKGAYTGAEASRSGRFERADGGTLFLDEVGELSLHAQATLLRVLQEGEVERLGGQDSRSVDVRIIAATNKDLMGAVKDGKFRSDLLYRLNTYTVTVPPLRNRHEDIPDLVEHFVKRYAATHGKGVMKVSDRALAMIRSYDWPGNVRELANVVERGVILAGSEQTIRFANLFPHIAHANEAESAVPRTGARVSAQEIADAVLNENVDLQSFEETLIARALERSGGNVSRAARLLGVSRPTLDYRLKRRRANG